MVGNFVRSEIFLAIKYSFSQTVSGRIWNPTLHFVGCNQKKHVKCNGTGNPSIKIRN